MIACKGFAPAVLALSILAGCLAGPPVAFGAEDLEQEDRVREWREDEVAFPTFPGREAWVTFYVSSATENRFFIDPAAISVGNDGVVRYVLIVVSGAGATNISFEGMRCDTRERRIYAFGRPDGTWSGARNTRWERIREAAGNRHHAALFQEYFCPDGVIVRNADEARDALQRGGHPAVKRW